MNIKRFWINGLVVMILGSILVGCYYYIKSVQTYLWTQNAEQAMEITSQGGRAFETYIEIEQERVHGLANKISELESHEESKILNNLNLLGGETSKDVYKRQRLDDRSPPGSWQTLRGFLHTNIDMHSL